MADDTLPIGGDVMLPGAGTLAQQDPPRLKSLDEYKNLPEGAFFFDPDGKKKQKPFRPKNPDEAMALPEGSYFMLPDGKVQQTPTYQGLDFTTQTLYNMAATESERQKALERGYPGKVKKNKFTGESYIEDDGTFRRAKGFTGAPGAFIASQAAPVAGAIGGEIAGGVLGSTAPGPGTVVGAIGGGAAGAAVGQAFNDAMLGLAGVYDRTKGEEAAELGGASAMGAVGTAGGQVLGATMPVVKAAVTQTLPRLANDVLGTDPEGLKFAIQMREKGIMVPPSIWAKEAPHIINIAEVFDPAFRTQKPLLQSATEHYESSAGKLLRELGVEPYGKISEPTAAITAEPAGRSILLRTRAELAKADAELKAKFDARQQTVAAGKATESETHQARIADLQRSLDDARAKAQQVVDAGFTDIRQSSDAAMAAAKAGHNSGDLWWAVGEKIKNARAAIQSRAGKMYDEADRLAGDIRPDVTGLSERAADFLQEMPENFQAQYPTVVKQIRDWAGVPAKDEHGIPSIDGGKWEKEPIEPTWAQLHNLRTILRQNYSRLDLTPNVKQGTFKFFANKVDEIISREDGDPRLAAAAKQLRAADNFYRENMGPLQDTRIQAVMNGLEAGLPADPKVLYDTIVKDGRTELINKVREMVGPTLWAGVAAADKREMLEQAKSLIPGQIDGKRFAQEVLERYRNGTLETVHGKATAERLLKQAQDVAMLNGFDVPVRPGDTLQDIVEKIRTTEKDIKALAKQDPLGTLSRDMKAVDRDRSLAQRDAAKKRQTDPLGFLYDLKLGANDAANRILDNEDLILAAAHKFGLQSPEFHALRQVWVQRVLSNTLEPGARLGKVSEETQRIMFPGMSLDLMRTLAKEMDFLMSSRSARDTAKSMAAVSHVEHPWGFLSKVGATKFIPGSDFVGRMILGKYFKLVTDLFAGGEKGRIATSWNPALLRYLEKGLKGSPEQREMARALVQRRAKMGGALGAGTAESQFQTPNESTFFQ